MRREITLAQVFEAMEKGGYTQGYNHLLESDSTEGKNVGFILNADAIGQAALNLGIEDTALETWLREVKLSRKFTTIGESIIYYLGDLVIYLNDVEHQSVEEIASVCKTRSKSFINKGSIFETYEWNNTNYQGIKV